MGLFQLLGKSSKKQEDDRNIIEIYESGSSNFCEKFQSLTLEEQIAAIALILEMEPSQKELNKWLTDNYGQLITSVWREKMTEGYSLDKVTAILKKRDKPQQLAYKGKFFPREIIEVAVDDGTKRTQEEWIEYFNNNNQVMVSIPDLYNAGKSKDKKLLNTLQKDFKDTWEVTSTRIFFQPNSLDARVVHYFSSGVIEPVEFEVVIPDYSSGNLVKGVLDDPNGLEFLQAIFGTEDDKGVILETLKCLSGKGIDNFRVWTPSQEGRKGDPVRRLLCGSDDDGYFSGSYGGSYFHVDCSGNLYIYNDGRSSLVRR